MGNGSVCWDVERFSFVFFDVTTSSSLFRWETVQSVGMWNGPVLSFSMLQRRNAELSVQMGNGSVCWDVERLLWYESIQCHMIFESIIKVRLAWLRWGTVQFCLFQCNNAEFSVRIGNGSVCWDGERFSLVHGWTPSGRVPPDRGRTFPMAA